MQGIQEIGGHQCVKDYLQICMMRRSRLPFAHLKIDCVRNLSGNYLLIHLNEPSVCQQRYLNRFRLPENK